MSNRKEQQAKWKTFIIFLCVKSFCPMEKVFLSVRNWKIKTRKIFFLVPLCGKNNFSNHEIISLKKFVSCKKRKWFLVWIKTEILFFVCLLSKKFLCFRLSRNIFLSTENYLPKTCQAKIVSRKKASELLSNPDK